MKSNPKTLKCLNAMVKDHGDMSNGKAAPLFLRYRRLSCLAPTGPSQAVCNGPALPVFRRPLEVCRSICVGVRLYQAADAPVR